MPDVIQSPQQSSVDPAAFGRLEGTMAQVLVTVSRMEQGLDRDRREREEQRAAQAAKNEELTGEIAAVKKSVADHLGDGLEISRARPFWWAAAGAFVGAFPGVADWISRIRSPHT